ncbi:MAG: hypothetical protein ACYCYO_18315 [Bacilli bacterium]
MNEVERFLLRVRGMTAVGLAAIVLTGVCWAVFGAIRPEMNGLLLGEVGGAYVVYSMVRQGHLKDGMMGRALFASGMTGMLTRLVVLVTVMVVAVKTPGVNPITALVGYLLGFACIFFGLYGFARNRVKSSGKISKGK